MQWIRVRAVKPPKRSLEATPSRALLLDIEGTTSSLAFVREVLFPAAPGS